jgi:Flp pilus assembly protein CpaB
MRRGRLLILLGIILAVAAAVSVYALLRQADTGDQPTAVGKRSVVVATQFIEAGTPLDTEGLLETREISEDALPPDPVAEIDLTRGMLAGGPIYAGSILQASMLLTPAEYAEQSVAAQLLEVGFEAVAFPINPLASVAYGIRANDRVDVLISVFFRDVEEDTQLEEPVCETCTTPEGEESVTGQQIPRLSTQLTLQDVRVLGLGVWAFEQPPTEETAEGEPITPPPQYVTLEVTAQDALVLKYAREVGAIVEFALRPTDDHQTYATEAVTLDYVLTRFNIPVPAKRTYTLLNLRDIEERGYR